MPASCRRVKEIATLYRNNDDNDSSHDAGNKNSSTNDNYHVYPQVYDYDKQYQIIRENHNHGNHHNNHNKDLQKNTGDKDPVGTPPHSPPRCLESSPAGDATSPWRPSVPLAPRPGPGSCVQPGRWPGIPGTRLPSPW